MDNRGSKVIAGSAASGAIAMLAILSFLPGLGGLTLTNVGGLISIGVAAIAGGSFANKALNYKLKAKLWLVLGPVYFAVIGFGLWAGGLSATYLLARMTNAKTSLSFWEFLGGLFTSGYIYGLLGLACGLVWSIPVALTFARHAFKKEATLRPLSTKPAPAKHLLAR